MNSVIKSTLLVTIQFSCIGFILIGSRINHFNIVAGILIGLSVLLASWAIMVMQKSKLRIIPQPSENAILITKGPYKIIRHPMYTSVLLCCFGFVWSYSSLMRLIVFFILLIDLLIKLHWEEKMLEKKFQSYQKYTEHTHKLIPYIY